jgi:predicted lipoprotein with Yx(FWY)xxD motif
MRKLVATIAAVGAVALLLAGCGSTSTSGTNPAAASSPAPPGSATSAISAASAAASGSGSAAATGAGLKITHSSLGSIVIDGAGRTLYLFTKDTKGSGKSSCTGECLATWPPLYVTGTPTGDGVTATLGTIPTPDGKKQVTLDGWPLYYFAGDKAAGDVSGQGLKGTWWVVTAAGAPISAAASSSAAGGGGGYG